MDRMHNRTLTGKYSGEGPDIFRLAFITSFFTLITAGIYRFWAKTRIRKFIWSSVSLNKDSFEYTGTGLEKLLGFLVAIVVLALYLAVIQMGLFYFGLSLFTEPTTMEEMVAQIAATYITIFAVVPLWFFAVYRARRYKLARTRWRGIRFGMEKGAWGYALRAIGHWFLTISTLGLLLPRQTFYLEKYMTDRSWYGNAQFHQGGKWTALYPAMANLAICVVLVVAGGALATASSPVLGVIVGIVGYVWAIIGLVSYRVKAFTYLTAHKSINGDVAFEANPQTGTVIKIVLLGGLAVALVAAVLFGIAGAALAAIFAAAGPGGSPVLIIAPLLLYVMALLVVGALSLAMITQPLVRHVVETLKVENADGLDIIRQRVHDDGADAEGFADALDVGGAI